MYQSFSKKKCVLIRHGRTKGNDERRFIGSRSDIGLSPEGIREALAAKEAVRSLLPGDDIRVFSSPMKRAAETAGLLFDSCPVTQIDGFAEIDFGDFDGKNHEELDGDPVYQAWIDSGGVIPVPGGESRDEFTARTLDAFYEVIRDCREETAVIVCHMGTIFSVMSSLTDGDYYDFTVGHLEGYILEYAYDHDTISDLSYNRFVPGDHP